MNSPPVLKHFLCDITNEENMAPFLNPPMLVDTDDTLEDFIKYITEWRVIFKEKFEKSKADAKNIVKFKNFD